MSDSILVTGGAGYVGSHVCKALATAGFHPVTLDNLCTGNPWAIRWGPLEIADIADPVKVGGLLERHGIDSVIHCAAYAYVGESMRDPGRYFDNNVAKTIRLLDTLVRHGVRRLVFSSSCAVYGVPDRLPITETSPVRPISPYGESKLFIENALEWYSRAHGLEVVSLRYFNAAGADKDGDIGEWHDPETHLVPLAIASANGDGPTIEIFGSDYPTPDGTAIRDYVHVTDLADAHLRALDRLRAGAGNQRLNLGTGSGYSVRRIIDAVAEIGAAPIETRSRPRRPGDPAELVADPSRAMRVLDWRPVHSGLDNIVRTAWNWHRDRGRIANQYRLRQ